MKKHTMRLQERPFERIRMGIKKVECRLNDEKRKKISVGDELFFFHMEDANRVIHTHVEKRIEASSFIEIFQQISPKDLGYDKIDAKKLAQKMHKYYDEKNEKSLGVVGFYVKIIESRT